MQRENYFALIKNKRNNAHVKDRIGIREIYFKTKLNSNTSWFNTLYTTQKRRC